MRNILESLGGKATQTQISSWLLGDIFNEAEFKRWWESTKKLLKRDGHFLIPTKKNEAIELRAAPVSRADELLTFFNQARQPKEQAAALDQIIKLHHEFEDAGEAVATTPRRDRGDRAAEPASQSGDGFRTRHRPRRSPPAPAPAAQRRIPI